MVSGCILGSFGIGGFLFNKIGTALFNPEGFSADPATGLFPDSVTSQFGSKLSTLAYAYAATAIAGACGCLDSEGRCKRVGSAEANAGWPLGAPGCGASLWPFLLKRSSLDPPQAGC